MKKYNFCAVIGGVCAVVSIFFIGFALWGLWGGNLAQTEKSGSEGIGHALTVVLILPILLVDLAALLVTAVLGIFSIKRCLAIGRGESEKIAVIILSVVFKCICLAGTLFCGALLFALDNGGLHGGVAVWLCVLLSVSVAAEIIVARSARAEGSLSSARSA